VTGPDHKKYGPSVLNPRQWIFSALEANDEGVNFTMTHVPNSGKPHYKSLVFRNWINYKNHSNCGGICLKYDVELIEYQWQSPDPEASLAFIYWISSSENNNDPVKDGDTISVGGGYFNIKSTADAIKSGSTKSVNVTLFQDKKDTFTIYSHFDGDLFHDPTIGVSPKPPLSIGVIIGIAVACLVVVVIVALIIFYLVRGKRKDYVSVS